MKRTIKSNIGGVIFHIDEDAYQRMSAYLDELERRIKPQAGGDEILRDIESRIAELLQQKSQGPDRVVGMYDVDSVLSTMGKPADYDTESPAEEPVSRSAAGYSRRTNRKLYRDPDDRMIGGVASGMAAYFNIDTVLFRLLFVLLFFASGFGFLAYIVLWMAIPPARTTAQKLEMRGEPVTLASMERFNRDEIGRDTRRSGDFFTTIFNGIFRIIAGIFKVFLIFIGSVFGLVFLVVLVSLVSALTVGVGTMWWLPHNMQGDSLSEVVNSLFVSSDMAFLAMICLLVVVAIPVFGVLYALLKALFRFKTNDRLVWIFAVVLWILSLTTLIVTVAQAARDIRYPSESTSGLTLPSDKLATLHVMAGAETLNYRNLTASLSTNMGKVLVDADNEYIYLSPKLKITQATGTDYQVKVYRRSRAATAGGNNQKAAAIDFNYHLGDSLLTIDRLFRVRFDDQIRIPEVEVVLEIPAGKSVFFDPALTKTPYDIDHLTGCDNIFGNTLTVDLSSGWFNCAKK